LAEDLAGDPWWRWRRLLGLDTDASLVIVLVIIVVVRGHFRHPLPSQSTSPR
jgi:hypothetical protein